MPSSADNEEATISIPSLAFVAVLGFFLYRYFTSSSRSSSSASSSRVAGQRFTLSQVDTVSQMFPQLNRRDIMWDLQRNGGSVPATTERILVGGGLAPAPPSFQPQIPVSTTPLPSGNVGAAKVQQVQENLITRYNLHSKINASDKGKERAEEKPVGVSGWATSKDQRQQVLQRRRDEMILAARRRMLEKDEEGRGVTEEGLS